MDLDPLLFGPDQPCFGCAPEHPIGFRLKFRREGESVECRFVPGEQYQGPPGIMHGGLALALADEIGAWTIVGLRGKFGFTTGMQARLRTPVRIGVELVGRGVLAHETSRTARVGVTISQGEGVAMTAEVSFAILDVKRAERVLGGPLPEAWRRFSRG